MFGGSHSEVSVSSDDEEWHTFLLALHDAFSAEPFTVKDLVGELRHAFSGGRIDAAALPGDLAEKWSHIRDGRDEGFKKSLGWWLKNRAGRYASGWSVVAAEADAHAKVARYAVKPPSDGAAVETPPSYAPDGDESAGLRAFTGFDPATREKGNSHFSHNGQGERPGENPQNPVTPPTGGMPPCWQCGRELVWPDEQQRGTCSRCRPTTNLFGEETTA